jgi:hypothetical protein
LAAVKHTTVKWLGCRCNWTYLRYSMVCSSQSGMTEDLYILYTYMQYIVVYFIHVKLNTEYILTTDTL